MATHKQTNGFYLIGIIWILFVDFFWFLISDGKNVRKMADVEDGRRQSKNKNRERLRQPFRRIVKISPSYIFQKGISKQVE
jgi:hypothetical protein